MAYTIVNNEGQSSILLNIQIYTKNIITIILNLTMSNNIILNFMIIIIMTIMIIIMIMFVITTIIAISIQG